MRSSAHGFLFLDRINTINRMSSEKSNGSASGNPENPVNPVKDNGSAPRTLPNSRKVYVGGKQHVEIRVPFREISLAPNKTMSGEIEINEPVRVYDTSGPRGDADFTGTADPARVVEQGLPALRA